MFIVRTAVTMLVIVIVSLGALFVDFSYKTFSYRQHKIKADAIVVLAGGKGRVDEGIKLYGDRIAPELLFVGVDPAVRKEDLYRPTAGDPPASGVYLEKASRNTLENAIFGRRLIAERRAGSILLITSRYHMKRACILFRNALPKDVTIYPYPVDSVNLKETWWYHQGSLRLLFSEFYKYCMFRAFFLLAPGELRGAALQ